MKLLKIICRPERVEAVVAELRAYGIPRLFLSRIHSLGSGVDPDHYRLEDGGPYTDKVKIEIACRAEEVPNLILAVRERACTGHRGDGVIIVSDVDEVVKIRTGDRNVAALL